MSKAEQDNSDLRLMELAARNPSLGGRALMLEIIERGPMPEENERPQTHDIRSALKAPSLDDPDYRTRIEHADWLGKESPTMRDLYEHGAEIKGVVLTIPAEEYEMRDDRETPFITTLSYAQERIGDNIGRAQEFHAFALEIGGETADARMQIAVFKHYYDRIARHERGNRFGRDSEAERTEALNGTLEEMRAMASEMSKLETRESVEANGAERIGSLDSAGDRDVEVAASKMNISARKVNLRDESLRFPAGLSYETKERLLSRTIPEIDRRLENGVSREYLFVAVDNTMFQRDSRDLTDRELKERGGIASFLKCYVDERMRDPETRALNTSAIFREARAAIINTTTPEALGRVAASFLRANEQRSEELRRRHSAPGRHPLPVVMPLNARERSLLFNGRAPDHHTREMRELRLNYGLSRAERAERIADLREGRIEPSQALRTTLQELKTRRTTKAIAHFQASILNEKMDSASRANLHSLSVMGRIERQLLNQAVSRLKEQPDREQNDLTITEARNHLPEKTREEIRLQARNLAWQSLVPEEVFDREPFPEAIRISDTIAHIQDHLQDRARIAQTARDDFVAEKVRMVEERLKDKRATMHTTEEERKQFAQRVLDSFSPADARRLADLDRYAAQTREDVYRGIETIDTQWRDLEIARDRNQLSHTVGSNPSHIVEVEFPDVISRTTNPRLPDAFVAPHPIVASEKRDQLGEFRALHFDSDKNSLSLRN